MKPTTEQHHNAQDYHALTGLLTRLYEALYRGDTQRLQTVFHPDARYVTASGDELLQLDMPAYMHAVAQRISPEKAGDSYGYEIESIIFAGPETACAKLRSTMLGKHFVDFLVLIKLNQQWQIISKVFHYTLQTPDNIDSNGESACRT